MIFGNKCSKATVTIRNSTVNESEYEKLIGIPHPNAPDSKSLSEFKQKILKNGMEFLASVDYVKLLPKL